jgi:tetrahydromethanopterin S-methyltransferase subunit G
MTAQVLFDTARFRDRLTSSGMPEPQARAVTEGFEALRDATATKSDVDRQGNLLQASIDAVEQRLDAVERRLDAKIDSLEQRLNARIDLLDESVGRRISETIGIQSRWMVASLFGGLGLLFAALKLFP